MPALSVYVVCSLSIEVASGGSSSAITRFSRSRNVATCELCRVLACEGNKLVTLASLWDLDAVLVEPFLDLAVTPAVQELIGKRLLSRVRRRGGRGGRRGGTVGCNTSVPADGGDQLVTAVRLRSRDATLVEPRLQIRIGPRMVEPVARVVDRLASLVRGALIVGAGGLEKRVASTGCWVGDAVVVKEGLELRFSPAVRSQYTRRHIKSRTVSLRVEDPVLHAVV